TIVRVFAPTRSAFAVQVDVTAPHPRFARLSGTAVAAVTIDVDLPPGVTITAYQRHGDGHGFEVAWPWPARCRCDRCHREADARIEVRYAVQSARAVALWAQPSSRAYQPAWHRCRGCNRRQHLLPPFERRDVSYTLRFEQHVLRSLV